ncbi:MAG: hypothetical protein SOV36_06700 [Anaerostipes faecalis]|nr:hypothetical protein [Anaerostipes faecalis]
MKFTAKCFLILLLLTIFTGCCGCKNQKDIEDSSYILAMGFEKNGDQYLVRYSYADFDNEKSNSGTKIPSKSITFLADSFADANKKWEKYQMKNLNFGHLKVIIFGNGVKDPKIIKELLRHPQIAKSVFVLKTDKSISDVFSKEKNLSISFGEYVAKSIENSEEITSPKNYTLGRIMY